MTEPEVLFDVQGHAGLITLNRPRALNALTLGMIRDITASLRRWMLDDAVRHVLIRSSGGKAFCAGGDIRALYEWATASHPNYFAFYREEYQLDTLIKRYPKPYIALLDGIFMGGGAGLSVHGSHRIGTERLTFAMPETGIGFFPDVGGSYFLPRLLGEIGTYLGLTGQRLGVVDTQYAGVTTHHVPSDRLERLAQALTEATDVTGCIEQFAADAGPASLPQHREAIDHHFSHESVEAILVSLESDPSNWAQTAAAELRKKSPTSLKVTFRQLRNGLNLDFEECMRLEYRIAINMLDSHDFLEGIRAVVIDKDQKPRWNPPTLEDVSDAAMAAYFAPVGEELPV